VMGEELLKPAAAAERLGLRPSTLRVYSARFAELLSESAGNPKPFPEGKAGHRLYTSRDLTVLGKAKELLEQGLTYDQALEEMRAAGLGLRARPRPSVASASEAGPLSTASTEALLKAVESWRALAEERGLENAMLRQRIEALEKELDSEMEELRERLLRLEDWARTRADSRGRLGNILGR